MEDASVLLDNLANEFTNLSGTWGFYAVYDGHGGSNTSSICSNMLHRQLCNSNKLTENIKGAFQIAYKETDAFALKESESKGFKDGSTAVTALIRANTLHIANAGDSEAVLCKVNQSGVAEAIVVSEIHRPTNVAEKQRIEKAGGAVFSGRVFGALAVSRSLGDGDFKIPISEANFVSAEPYYNSHPLTKEHTFLLLACDGLFDKLSPQESITFVHERLTSGVSLSDAAEQLADLAIEKQTTDNVTVVIVQFNWK